VDNVMKCRLRPPKRSVYRVTFTDAQWRQLRAIFPDGVCDYRSPAVGAAMPTVWHRFR
jgi:hypothetical protein